MKLFRSKESGVDYDYSITDESLQKLLKIMHDFHYKGESICPYKSWGGWEEKEVMQSSEYLRGVAAQMPDPERLKDIADLLDGVCILFCLHIDKAEVQNDAN